VHVRRPRSSVGLILTPLSTTIHRETARQYCVSVQYGFVCEVVIYLLSAIKTQLYPVLSSCEMYSHWGPKGQNICSESVLWPGFKYFVYIRWLNWSAAGYVMVSSEDGSSKDIGSEEVVNVSLHRSWCQIPFVISIFELATLYTSFLWRPCSKLCPFGLIL